MIDGLQKPMQIVQMGATVSDLVNHAALAAYGALQERTEGLMVDLVIRGATVVDGLGNDPKRADVAVKDGKIVAIGAVSDKGNETIDADGLVLSPGIVDVHTHYDAQVTWDATLSPSPSLGVTTAVIGNCGFGIVPAPPAVRDLVIRNLSVVEGMDLDALRAGIKWDFESFSDYMGMLRRTRRLRQHGGAGRPFDHPHRGDGRGCLAAQGRDAGRARQDEGDGGRRHGPRRHRPRRLLFAQSFGLWRRAHAVDHRADVGARRAGRRHGAARQGRGRDRLGREDAAGAGADGRQVRKAVFPGHWRGDVQRAGAQPGRSRCSRTPPPPSAAASGSTSRSPASRCRSISRWPTPIRSTAIRRSTRSRPTRRSS